MNGLMVIFHLMWRFSILSLISFGGVNAMISEIQRLVVNVDHWVTNEQFSALFAVAQIAPGPNVLIATLVGLEIGGVTGGVATSVAMIGPSSCLTYFFYKIWQKWPAVRWRNIIQLGLAPVTIGLILSSGYLIARASAHTWGSAAVTLAAIAVTYRTRINPLWLFAAAGLAGALGLV